MPKKRRSPVSMVVYGIDSENRPRAARFDLKYEELVLQAATNFRLRTTHLRKKGLLKKLPRGDVFAPASRFVCPISRTIFEKLLLSQATRCRIDVRCGEEPQLARLVIAGRWNGDVASCRGLLEQVCSLWPTAARTHCLVTCGAFLRFGWPEQLLPNNFLTPEQGTIKSLTQAAERVVRDLLDRQLVLRLRQVTTYLSLGIDTPLHAKMTTRGNRITNAQAEMVCVVDLSSEPFRVHWTGKSYPSKSQEGRLVRITDITSHFTKLRGIGEVQFSAVMT
jgi:hypothetical protein